MEDRWIVLGVAAVIPLATAIPTIVACWRGWREARLGRGGAEAVGEVVRIQDRARGRRLIHLYTIDYRFRDGAGQDFQGRLKTRNPRRWAFYDGAPLDVRYDPKRPARNTLRNA